MDPRGRMLVPHGKWEHSVIDTINYIHTECTGTYQHLNSALFEHHVDWLSWRITEAWHPSTMPRATLFEQVLLCLANVTMMEGKAEIASRQATSKLLEAADGL